jgi:hypothetical protein
MSGENSCFSRFLVKFVEVSAAGLATAISAYALAHLGGLLPSSTTPTSAPATAVQVSPTASEIAEGLRAKPTHALIEPGLADTRSAPVDIQPHRADVPPRQADVGRPPPVAVPPRAPGIEAAPHPLDVQSPPVVQSSPVAPVDIQPRPVVGVDPPPRTSEIPRPPMPVGTASPEGSAPRRCASDWCGSIPAPK